MSPQTKRISLAIAFLVLGIILILKFLLSFSITQPLLYVPKSEAPQLKKDQEIIQYEVVVTLKLIQAYVTDKEGNPVLDLTKSDFELFDNGELMNITDFERYVTPRPVKKEEELKQVEPVTPLNPPSRLNRKFFLLIDFYYNDPQGIMKSKKAAQHFVETQLLPTDEVSVLSYSAFRGIVLYTYLTADHQKALSVINEISEQAYRPMGGPSLSGLMAQAEREAELAREGEIQESFFRFDDPETEFAKAKTLDFTKNMREFSKALNYIPGYKNVIFFSAGIPRPLIFAANDPTIRYSYEEMGKELAASSTPVYTVNAEGTRGHLKPRPSRGVDSLKMLSGLTGGKYFENVDEYEVIAEEIQNVTGNYYVLGYYIDETWDGKFHEIEVKVKRSGCIIHAQSGYFSPKPFTKYSHLEKQLHLIELAFSENPYFQEPLNFPLIALPSSREKEQLIVLLSEIAVDRIKDAVGEETELATLVIDQKNNIVDSRKGEVDFSTIPQKNVYYYTVSALSPGQYECRVVIRNLKTGKGAVASSSVIVSEAPDPGMALYPPLLLIPDRVAFYLKFSKKDEKEEAETARYLNIIYPFISNKYTPLISELDKDVTKLLGIVRCRVSAIKTPEVSLSAYLKKHSLGEEIPLALVVVSTKKDKETDVLFVELELPELSPDIYTLLLTAREITTGAQSQATQTFRVK